MRRSQKKQAGPWKLCKGHQLLERGNKATTRNNHIERAGKKKQERSPNSTAGTMEAGPHRRDGKCLSRTWQAVMGEDLRSNILWILPGTGSDQLWCGCCIPSNLDWNPCMMLFIVGPLGVMVHDRDGTPNFSKIPKETPCPFH